jgi:hypothetical protein
MDTSRFLAKALGIYLLIVSVATLANMEHFIQMVDALLSNAPLMFVTGFFTLILGILFVLSHNIWQWDWRLMITIFAWMTLLKGASIILYPQLISVASMLFIQDTMSVYISAILDAILGVLLCYFGFRRT